MHHHDVDPADFLRDVHDIDFSVLDPDHGLNDILRDLPGRKIVYTNAPRNMRNKRSIGCTCRICSMRFMR